MKNMTSERRLENLQKPPISYFVLVFSLGKFLTWFFEPFILTLPNNVQTFGLLKPNLKLLLVSTLDIVGGFFGGVIVALLLFAYLKRRKSVSNESGFYKNVLVGWFLAFSLEGAIIGLFRGVIVNAITLAIPSYVSLLRFVFNILVLFGFAIAGAVSGFFGGKGTASFLRTDDEREVRNLSVHWIWNGMFTNFAGFIIANGIYNLLIFVPGRMLISWLITSLVAGAIFTLIGTRVTIKSRNIAI